MGAGVAMFALDSRVDKGCSRVTVDEFWDRENERFLVVEDEVGGNVYGCREEDLVGLLSREREALKPR